MIIFWISEVPPPIEISFASRIARSTGILLDVAVAPEDLGRLDRVAHRGLGDEVLSDARLDLVRQTFLLHPRGPVENERAASKLGLHLGELVLDRLVLGDRLAEGDALLRVVDRRIER